jgi:hypothetical protein
MTNSELEPTEGDRLAFEYAFCAHLNELVTAATKVAESDNLGNPWLHIIAGMISFMIANGVTKEHFNQCYDAYADNMKKKAN